MIKYSTAETAFIMYIIATESCFKRTSEFSNPEDKAFRSESWTSIAINRKRSRRTGIDIDLRRVASLSNKQNRHIISDTSWPIPLIDSNSLSEKIHGCEPIQLRAYKHVVAAAQNLLLRAYLLKGNNKLCVRSDERDSRLDSGTKGWSIQMKLDGPRPCLSLGQESASDLPGAASDGNDFDRLASDLRTNRDTSTSSPAVQNRNVHKCGTFARQEDAREAITSTCNLFLLDATPIDQTPDTPMTAIDEAQVGLHNGGACPRPTARAKWRSAVELRAAAELAAAVWARSWDAAAVHRRAAIAFSASAKAGAGAECMDVLAGLSDGVQRATARIDGLRELQVRCGPPSGGSLSFHFQRFAVGCRGRA